jgi:hypothetical protein
MSLSHTTLMRASRLASLAAVVAGIVVASSQVSPATAAPAATVCLGPDSFATQVVLPYVDSVLLSTSSNYVNVKNSVGVTYSTTVSKIVFVTDERTCGNVQDGINTASKTPGVARQLYVIGTGSGYAALEPHRPGPVTENTPLFFLTKQYVVTGGVAF